MKILKAEQDNLIIQKQYFKSKLTKISESDEFQKKARKNVFKKQSFYIKFRVIGL